MYFTFNQTLDDPSQILTPEQKDMAAGDIKVIIFVVLGVVGIVCLMLCFRYLHMQDQRRKREKLRRKCQLPPDLLDADPEDGSVKPSTEVAENQPSEPGMEQGTAQAAHTAPAGAETQIQHHFDINNQNANQPAINTTPKTVPRTAINQEPSLHYGSPMNSAPTQQQSQVHTQSVMSETEDPFPSGPIGRDWTPY